MQSLPDPITFRLLRPPAHSPEAGPGFPVGKHAGLALQLLLAGLLAGILVWENQHFNGIGPWQTWTAFLILPAVATAATGTFLLAWPATPAAPLPFRRHGLLCCACALAATTLSPFFVWWLRMPDCAYFAICAHLAMFATAWMLFECTGWLHALFASRGYPILAVAAWFVQFLFYFFFVLIVTIIPVIYRLLILKEPNRDPGTVMFIWKGLPEKFLHSTMLAPCLGLLVLLVLAQLILMRTPQPAAVVPEVTPEEVP